jgi:hypothetical protein
LRIFPHNSTGMGVKSDDNGFPGNFFGLCLQLINNTNMSDMNTIKSADSYNGIPELWQIADISVNLHGEGKIRGNG